MSAGDPKSLTEVDRVIHEPARLMIVALLTAVKEADFLYLQRESGLTKGNLSSHLAKLEESKYVEVEKTYRGKVPLTLLRITPTGHKAFEDYKRQLNGILGSAAKADGAGH